MISTTAKSTSLPLYLQLSEFLIREISVGRLADGDKFPPEREMAKNHQTTVTTLRKALAILEQKGLLERVHGSGNYIRQKTSVDSVYSMFRLELIGGGGLPTAKLISVKEKEKPCDLPKFGTSNRATQIRRLRFLDSTLVALEEIWLDRDAGQIDDKRLQDSLYRYYEKHLRFWISRAQDAVGIGSIPDWGPSEFSVLPGEPSGYIERMSWAQGSEPVEFSRTWFDSQRCNYVQRLK